MNFSDSISEKETAVSYISYNGKKVLHIDYSLAKNQGDMLEILSTVAGFYERSHERVNALANMNGAFFGMEYMKELKRLTPKVFAPKNGKVAIYGMSGIQSILVKGFNAVMPKKNALVAFGTKEEALDYLTR